MHVGNDCNLTENDKKCSHHIFTAEYFEPIICLFFFFPLSHQLFRTKEEVSNSVSYCFHAFFQHRIVWFWREHLLKVFQNFEKIEADATLSTLVEFNVFFFFFGQMIRFASVGVWNLLWRAHSPSFLWSIFLLSLIHCATAQWSCYTASSLYSSFSWTQIYSYSNLKLLFFVFTIIIYNEA